MILLISPTKQMDFESELSVDIQRLKDVDGWGKPFFTSESVWINEKLSKLKQQELESLMNISPAISAGVMRMIGNFGTAAGKTRPAAAAYSGTVFKAIDFTVLGKVELRFAQSHLRILSGMYGLLKPFDGIEAYRLEMKTPLHIDSRQKLLSFWKDRLAFRLAEEEMLKDVNVPILNLASGEYMKAVDKAILPNPVISISFKEQNNNILKTIGMYSKTARGQMVRMILQDKISEPEALKSMAVGEYRFSADHSSDSNWIYIRREYV